ncbi:MAG: PQQ-like beta-propeller repeat protein [Gemmataceae bacterium]|nr:PQQ-like beta-propeller repeat protein [Gemmataceae bacterium]
MKRISATICVVLLAVAGAWSADWPHWLGPNYNGASPETGLLTTWPTEGPKVLWKVEGGDGYSSIAVANGRAITLVQKADGEYALALDAVKGKEMWKQKIGPFYKNSYGNGPRSTPTIEGGLVYVQSVTGPLVCLKAENGDIVWQKDLLKDFKAKNIQWGLSASPVIEGDLVLAIPGGEGAGVAAFDKKTGKTVWTTGDDKAAYASPVAVTVGGQRQIIFFTAAGLLAVSPDKGKELWRVPWTTEFDCNICTPLVISDKLFVTSGEFVGCALFQLQSSGPPKVLWESKGKKSVMTNYWANSVLHEGHLYGFHGQFDQRIDLHCVEAATGKLKWSKEDYGKGAVLLADGHLFLTTKKGDLVLARTNSEKYEEKARVSLLGENRTVPTLAHKRLYVRDRKNIFCLDVTGSK